MSNPPGQMGNGPGHPGVPSDYPNIPPGYPSVPPGYPQGPTYLPTGDLRTYVTVLRRRKWSVALGLLLICGLIGLYTARQTPQYDSTAEVLVKPLSPNQILQGVNYNFLVSMQTEEALVSSPAVADAAAQIVKAGGAPGREPGSVSTTVPDQTTFLDITYTSGDGASAQLWANAYAEAYVANRQAQAGAAYQTMQKSYQDELTKLEARFRNTQEALSSASGEQAKTYRRTLQSMNQQITSLQTQLANVPVPSTDSAQVLAPAGLPSSPSSPNYVRNAALAIVLGLGLGIGIAFVRERLDERITSREDLEGLLGASVLAVVPKVSNWRKRSSAKLVARERPKSAPAEAYRAVRTNVDFLARTSDLKVIALTSPSLGEGKTTTTANLAITMAQTGKRVIAVSCDLRKPRLHRFFGLSNSKGLTDLLTVGTPLTEIVQRSGDETLRIIPSGPIPPNPAELLGSNAMERFFEDIRHAADYVLVDTAPVIAVSDATILAPQCDGVIVVVDATSTSRTAVTVLRGQLERVGVRILGGIYNNFDPRHSKSYPGHYRYYTYGYKSRKKSDEIISGNGKPANAADAANIWH
jgi:succinoglycan biosynthesis transport protein ExoP